MCTFIMVLDLYCIYDGGKTGGMFGMVLLVMVMVGFAGGGK